MSLYISEEGYLCYNQTIYDEKLENGNILIGKPIGLKQIKFKVGNDGLLKQVTNP